MPFEKMKENLGRFLFSARLRKLASKALSERMEPSQVFQLLEGEAESIEHQAQEWNYV